MRLYSRTNVTAVNHDGVRYEPADDGGFDFPPALEQHLHSVNVAKQPQWETEIERQRRLIAEEAARRADPATLLDAVLALQQQAAAGAAVAKAAEKPRTRRARKTAGTAEVADSETPDDGDDGDGDDADDE